MSWATDWSSAFGIFSRPVTYSRDETSVTVAGFVSTAKQEEVAGDFTSKTCKVTILASQLQNAGLYPPQEFDRVILGDSIPRVVSQFHIDYIQNVPQWVRLVVSG